MLATHQLACSLVRSRKFAVAVGMALMLVLSLARIDTADASETFPDTIKVWGVAQCNINEWPMVRHFQVSFAAAPAGWGTYEPPQYTPTNVYFRVRNVRTNQIKAQTTNWIAFLGQSPAWTLGPYADDTYIVEAAYYRVINGVTWKSTDWDPIRTITYRSGVIGVC